MTTHQHRTTRGFTLMELLAVVVILALALSIIGRSLPLIGRSANLDGAEAAWQRLDHLGRIHARMGTRCALSMGDNEVKLVAVDGDGPIRSSQLPQDVVMTVVDVSGRQVITYDRRGVSRDYVCELEADGATRRFTITGLTGLIERISEEPRP